MGRRGWVGFGLYARANIYSFSMLSSIIHRCRSASSPYIFRGYIYVHLYIHSYIHAIYANGNSAAAYSLSLTRECVYLIYYYVCLGFSVRCLFDTDHMCLDMVVLLNLCAVCVFFLYVLNSLRQRWNIYFCVRWFYWNISTRNISTINRMIVHT